MTHSPFGLPLKRSTSQINAINDADDLKVIVVRLSEKDKRKMFAGLEPDTFKMQNYVIEAVNQHDALVSENEALKKRLAELEAQVEESMKEAG